MLFYAHSRIRPNFSNLYERTPRGPRGHQNIRILFLQIKVLNFLSLGSQNMKNGFFRFELFYVHLTLCYLRFIKLSLYLWGWERWQIWLNGGKLIFGQNVAHGGTYAMPTEVSFHLWQNLRTGSEKFLSRLILKNIPVLYKSILTHT